MIREVFALNVPGYEQPATLFVAGGVWMGDVCCFEFAESLYGTSGVIRCDWRQPQPDIEITEGSGQFGEQLRPVLARLLAGFHSGSFAGITDAELTELYSGGYHREQNYATGSDAERARKAVFADKVIALTRPQKVLVAGCSAGETVRQLRARGVEAWGFDICPDLPAIAYPEVQDFVRVGTLQAIPFGPEDGFDTLTAFDLFEHIPEDRIPACIAELQRIGVGHVVALIAHCEFNYPGHITLRPGSWWDRQFGVDFERADFATPALARHRAIDPGIPDPTTFFRVYRAAAVGASVR